MKKVIIIALAATLLITLAAVPAVANDTASSTIVFNEIDDAYELTYDSDTGIYSGVIPCKVDGGFDVYAKEGASAWFGDNPGPVWDEVTIVDHDAFPTWDTDTPDWYQYSISFYEEGGVQKWAIRNHAGATDSDPWYNDVSSYPARGVPMSGTMDWKAMYALETDTGAYLPGMGTPEIPDGAVGKGETAGAWDMDWSWGSELVPLQYPGFDVEITGDAGSRAVTLTPAAASGTNLYTTIEGIIAIQVDPTSIDYGTLFPGQSSDTKDITVTNIGDVVVNVSVLSVTPTEGGTLINQDNLTLDSAPAMEWTSLGLTVDSSDVATSQLTVPSDFIPGGYEEGVITFEAATP